MSDPEDMRLLLSGELDLSSCDFSNADLHRQLLEGRNFTKAKLNGANLTKANLSGSVFLHAQLMSVKASAANFSRSKFHSFLQDTDFSNSNLTECDFSYCNIANVNFRGANLSGAIFSFAQMAEGNNFDAAITDDATNFSGATVSRSSSRHIIFQSYRFADGKLQKEQQSNKGAANDKINSPNDTNALRVISNRISSNSADYALLAASLADLLSEETDRLLGERPNDAILLEKHTAYIELLDRIKNGLLSISAHLQSIPSYVAKPDANSPILQASNTVYDLYNETNSWIRQNKNYAIDIGAKTALLGAGFTFLKFCGAPVEASFYTMGFFVGGKHLLEAVTGKSDIKTPKSR